MKKNKQIYYAITAAIILVALYSVSSLLSICDVSTKIDPTCADQNTVRTQTCTAGITFNTETDCKADERCSLGKCVPAACTADTTLCLNDYYMISRHCVSGVPFDSKTPCNKGEMCSDGKCVESNVTFALSSWDTLWQQIETEPQLKEYLKCGGVFDCDNENIKNLAERIYLEYNVVTPRDYVKAVNTYVGQFIDYKANGGSSQCGESASDLLAEYNKDGIVYGNCVDYSTLAVTLLRVRGIPAREAAGCVNVNLFCRPFAAIPGAFRAGNLNSQQVLAHAYGQVWLDKETGWATIDPTQGNVVDISKCIGYNTMVTSENNVQTCYIPIGYSTEVCSNG